jgi:hypothetical protein
MIVDLLTLLVCMNMLVCQADQSRIRIRAHGPYFHLTCQFHGDIYLILIGRLITSALPHPHTALILATTPTSQRLLHLELWKSSICAHL